MTGQRILLKWLYKYDKIRCLVVMSKIICYVKKYWFFSHQQWGIGVIVKFLKFHQFIDIITYDQSKPSVIFNITIELYMYTVSLFVDFYLLQSINKFNHHNFNFVSIQLVFGKCRCYVWILISAKPLNFQSFWIPGP